MQGIPSMQHSCNQHFRLRFLPEPLCTYQQSFCALRFLLCRDAEQMPHGLELVVKDQIRTQILQEQMKHVQVGGGTGHKFISWGSQVHGRHCLPKSSGQISVDEHPGCRVHIDDVRPANVIQRPLELVAAG